MAPFFIHNNIRINKNKNLPNAFFVELDVW